MQRLKGSLAGPLRRYLIVNAIALEAPPPGDGLTTVMFAVPFVAIKELDTVAFNCVADIYVVASGDPFQLIVEVVTN